MFGRGLFTRCISTTSIWSTRVQHQSYGSSNLDNAAYADQSPQQSHQPQPYGQPDENGQINGKTSYSSLTIPSSKGEILIHRPAPIIVKRPPTKVLVNHPPLVVKPAPVILHKPPPVVVRKVFVKHHPRPVKVEPVYVNVVKPPADHYYVNEKPQKGCNKCNKPPQPQPPIYKPVRNYEQPPPPPPQNYEQPPQNYEVPAYDNKEGFDPKTVNAEVLMKEYSSIDVNIIAYDAEAEHSEIQCLNENSQDVAAVISNGFAFEEDQHIEGSCESYKNTNVAPKMNG
uniref:Uncharacterized protein n=1 Tax=Megaselia scalaris TaxID=36166 RepID=T1GV54_MEGSC